MGFPYFLICYHGQADMSSDAGAGQGGGGDGNCDGYGETWGPGIGPPPPRLWWWPRWPWRSIGYLKFLQRLFLTQQY